VYAAAEDAVKIVGAAKPAPAMALFLINPRRVRFDVDINILPYCLKTRMSLLSPRRATHLHAKLVSRCFRKLRNNVLEIHNYFVNKYTIKLFFCKLMTLRHEKISKTQ
jgi:hypothetical protein